MKSKAIGVFDSGLGGLTVVKEINRLLPEEKIIYLGDTARVPYGTRSKKIVIKFSLEDTEFLLKKDVKCLVIACNTASSFAYEEVKNNVNIPVFNVVSAGVRYLVNSFKPCGVGVIGTRGTISSHSYQKSFELLDNRFIITEVACPLFVPVIEEGEIEGPLISLLIKKYLSVIKKGKVNKLILGCTHYPLIQKSISKYLSSKIELINPGYAVSLQLKDHLVKNDMGGKRKHGEDEFYLTDYSERFKLTAEKYLGRKLTNIREISLENV